MNGNLTLGRLGGVRVRVPLLAEGTRAVDVLADLSSRPGANRGLVVDNGHLEGLLSITDLARAPQVGRPPRPVSL